MLSKHQRNLQKLKGRDREAYKARALAALDLRGRHVLNVRDIEISLEIGHVRTVSIGNRLALEITARAWKNGLQVGFGSDGSVDVERFRIYSPPLFVSDAAGIREDPAAALLAVLYQIVRITGKSGSNIKRGKIGRTTSTFFPEPEAETNACDGKVFHDDTNVTWATLRDGAGSGQDGGAGASTVVRFDSGSTTDRWNDVTRSIFQFYTESIPGANKITSAVLSLYGAGKANEFGGLSPDPKINIYSAAAAAVDGLAAGDFDSLGTVPYCDTPIAHTDYDDAGYNDFALNALGIAAITKTGTSQFGAREVEYDAANIEPDWQASKVMYFGANMADASGTSTDPMLVVEHTLGFRGRVTSDADDAQSREGAPWDEQIGTADFTDGVPYMAYSNISLNHQNGFIFRSTDIPQGATIVSAVVTIQRGDVHNTETLRGKWHGYDVDSPDVFNAAHTHELKDHHSLVSTSVQHDFTTATSTTPLISPDLATVVQDIVDRAGFSGDLGLLWAADAGASNHCYQQIKDYSQDPDLAALLEVEWEYPLGKIIVARSITAGGANNDGVTSSAIDLTGLSIDFIAGAVAGYRNFNPPLATLADSESNTYEELDLSASLDHVIQPCDTLEPVVAADHTFSSIKDDTYPSVGALCLHGVDAAAPRGEENTAAAAAATTIAHGGGVTPDVPDCLVVSRLAISVIPGTFLAPTDLAIGDGFVIKEWEPPIDGVYVGMAIAHKRQTTAEAEDPDWTWTGSVIAAASHLTYYRPATGEIQAMMPAAFDKDLIPLAWF